MRWIFDLKIRYKILLLALIGMGGFLAYLLFNYSVATANAERLGSIRDVYFPTLEKTDANLVKLDKIKETLNAAAAAGEVDMINEADKLAASMSANFDEMTKINSANGQFITYLQQTFDHYYALAKSVSAGMANGSLTLQQMQSKSAEMQAALEQFQTALRGFRDSSYATFTLHIEQADKAAQQAIKLGIIIGLVVFALLVAATPLITSLITGDIARVVDSLKEMAAGGGDLTRRLESRGRDEIGELVDEFNSFVEQLRKIIVELQDASTQMVSASDQVADVASNTSQHVTRQQSETENVATAVNQLVATVQEMASHANNAANATQEADQESEEGRRVVSKTVSGIDALATKVNSASEVIHKLEMDAQGIGSVLDVIRGIAEQTNLLALNAAIEAARAGDQGRGFAVVADEVRTLASRTQASTQEIRDMIERLQTGARNAVTAMNTSRDEAQELVSQAARAGESLRTITQAVGSIAHMSLQIASATEEQSHVTEGIDANLMAIRDITTKTAEGADQTNASSQELARLAMQVQGLVNRFRV